MTKKAPTAEVRRHWNRIAELGCMITDRPYPTIHHCHGGSIKDLGIMKGMGLKTSPWLVIPLDALMHTGALGIDSGMGVLSWENCYGTQVQHLDRVCVLLGFNVWERAGIDRPLTCLERLGRDYRPRPKAYRV